jgi:hypothetical protein
MTLHTFVDFRLGLARRYGGFALALLLGAMVGVPACSDDNGPTADDGGVCPDGGGPAAAEADAAPDDHCQGDAGPIVQPATTCPSSPGDAAVAGGDAGEEPMPMPHPGTEADDDDCKFHVKYSVSCVAEGRDVTFTVTPTALTDMSKVTGAKPYIEAFLTEVHPVPNSGAMSTENDGVYTIGPIRFDAPGKWTVRFHFFAQCLDTEATTKHTHVAFFVNVP